MAIFEYWSIFYLYDLKYERHACYGMEVFGQLYMLRLLLVSVLLIINVAFNARTDCGPIDIQQDNVSRTEQIKVCSFHRSEC